MDMKDLNNQLLSSVRDIGKYRWPALGLMWLVGTAGWLRVATLPDYHQSTARVVVDTQSILKPLLNGMATLPKVEQQVADMMARLRISETSTCDIDTITVNHNNPKLVRDVVQSLPTTFVEGSFKGKKSDSHQAVQFIDAQVKSVEERLVATEGAVKNYKTQVSDDAPVAVAEARAAIINPELDARISAINKNLDNLRMQYTELHPHIVGARRLLARLEARKIEEHKRGGEFDPGRNDSPMLQQMKGALTETDAKIAALRVRVQEYAARYAHLREQVASVRDKHATELLAGRTMSLLLDEIAGRYKDRIVIFDSPPLLTTEAGVLASMMGQAVLMVEPETTTRRAVKEALRRRDKPPRAARC